MEKISSRTEYDMVKVQIEALITRATEEGYLESNLDNDYKREISRLGRMMADFEEYFNKSCQAHSPSVRY